VDLKEIAQGGCIFNNSTGTLTIMSAVISGSTAQASQGGFGGGIFNTNTGTLDITSSTISGNSANATVAGPNEGGGMDNSSTGTVTITNSLISGNSAGERGGGMDNNGTGTVNITNSTITGNSAEGSGGGMDNSGTGTVNIANSTISDNSTEGGGGGYIGSGALNIAGSTISGNTGVLGGGVYASDGAANITGSTISGNTAPFGGGGVFCNNGALTVTNSTISGNASPTGQGGGVSVNAFVINGAMVTLINDTISGNTASGGQGGGAFAGNETTLNLTNCTVSNNSAAQGGGVFSSSFFTNNPASTVNSHNTIIALNTASDTDPDVVGPFTSAGHNLIGKGDGSTGLTNGVMSDQIGSVATPLDPKLGLLANNGGPTQTLALLAGSPAIDAGDDSVLGPPLSLTTDQRGPGFPRKSGAHVDIGAFEFQSFDTCLKDNTTGNLLQWNSATGAYMFTRCSDGFTLSGTGAASLVNGMRRLTDSKIDRRVSAAFNTGQRTGSAAIYLEVAQGVWQTFQISDTNPSAVCACAG
jgi:hypothetical protein